MIDYSLILVTNYGNKQWSLSGNSYDGLTWLDSSPKPTKEELDSQWNAIQAEYDANEYQRLRAKEYPSFADQLDTIYHDGIDAWKEQINTIKEKYPKG